MRALLIGIRDLAAILALLAIGICAPSMDASPRRGAVAFRSTPIDDRHLAWYGRFEVLVTHDPLPPSQVAFLHGQGTRLALYEWAGGFYDSVAGPQTWQGRLLRSNRAALLNRRGLRGALGSDVIDAYYYDPASHAHGRDRARVLVRRLRQIGYDGLFFDVTTVHNLHPRARAEYQRRHPRLSYDAAFERFLKSLRKLMPEGLILTNQGYREADHYLPYVDWDVTESLITSPDAGALRFRPWNNSADSWNSVSFLMEHLIEPARRKYPAVRFVHLNYIDRITRKDIVAILTMARLYDMEAFVAPSTEGREDEEIDSSYFHDLGAPVSSLQTAGTTEYRWFERGMAAVNAGEDDFLIVCSNVESVEDLSTGRTVSGPIRLSATGDRPAATLFVVP